MAKKNKIVFKFVSPTEVKQAVLCGTFTNWEQGGIVMTRGKSGEWKASVSLEPGEYEYKIRADGVWYNDPAAGQVNNSFGSVNSLMEVR